MPKPRKTKAEKAHEALTERICTKALSEAGAQINLLDIPKFYRVVSTALAAGPDAEYRAREAADAWVAANRTNKVKPLDLAPSTVHYRTHAIERDGTEWTSDVGFEAPEAPNKTAAAHIAQACIAGHLMGSYYWCTEEGTGRFLDGRGPKGDQLTVCPVTQSPAYDGVTGRPIYFPAVRIYNPHPRLTYHRVRGSAHTLIAFDVRDPSLGAEPVGWVLGEDVPAGSVVS